MQGSVVPAQVPRATVDAALRGRAKSPRARAAVLAVPRGGLVLPTRPLDADLQHRGQVHVHGRRFRGLGAVNAVGNGHGSRDCVEARLTVGVAAGQANGICSRDIAAACVAASRRVRPRALGTSEHGGTW